MFFLKHQCKFTSRLAIKRNKRRLIGAYVITGANIVLENATLANILIKRIKSAVYTYCNIEWLQTVLASDHSALPYYYLWYLAQR